MKRFKFRFTAVKNQRQVILDQKLAKKAAALAELNQAIAELQHLQGLYIATLQGGPAVGELFNAQQETWRQLRLFSLREEIQQQEHLIAQLEERLAEIQEEVTEAHRDLKAMEVIEKKDREAWKKEFKAHQQKETDEINTTRFGR
jgi:flagellar export protein FliJ